MGVGRPLTTGTWELGVALTSHPPVAPTRAIEGREQQLVMSIVGTKT